MKKLLSIRRDGDVNSAGMPVQDSRKKLVRVAARAIVVLLVVTGVCLFSVSGLKREVTHLVQQTLPGLQYAAMANSLVSDGYVRCLNLVSSAPVENFEDSLTEIHQTTRQVDVYMEKYRDTIFDKEDAANFSKVQSVRDKYLHDRDAFFALLKDRGRTESLRYFKSEVTPAYNQYSETLNQLFKHKVEIGQIRREQVMLLSFVTPIVVGILFVLLFILGVLVSFKFIVH